MKRWQYDNGLKLKSAGKDTQLVISIAINATFTFLQPHPRNHFLLLPHSFLFQRSHITSYHTFHESSKPSSRQSNPQWSDIAGVLAQFKNSSNANDLCKPFRICGVGLAGYWPPQRWRAPTHPWPLACYANVSSTGHPAIGNSCGKDCSESRVE